MGIGLPALFASLVDLEIAARALAKAASASGTVLAKSAISKTAAPEPDLTCARLLPEFSKGNAAANDGASIIACRRLRIGIREPLLRYRVCRRQEQHDGLRTDRPFRNFGVGNIVHDRGPQTVDVIESSSGEAAITGAARSWHR